MAALQDAQAISASQESGTNHRGGNDQIRGQLQLSDKNSRVKITKTYVVRPANSDGATGAGHQTDSNATDSLLIPPCLTHSPSVKDLLTAGSTSEAELLAVIKRQFGSSVKIVEARDRSLAAGSKTIHKRLQPRHVPHRLGEKHAVVTSGRSKKKISSQAKRSITQPSKRLKSKHVTQVRDGETNLYAGLEKSSDPAVNGDSFFSFLDVEVDKGGASTDMHVKNPKTGEYVPTPMSVPRRRVKPTAADADYEFRSKTPAERRQTIVDYYNNEANKNYTATSKYFYGKSWPPSTVHNILNRYIERGTVENRCKTACGRLRKHDYTAVCQRFREALAHLTPDECPNIAALGKEFNLASGSFILIIKQDPELSKEYQRRKALQQTRIEARRSLVVQKFLEFDGTYRDRRKACVRFFWKTPGFRQMFIYEAVDRFIRMGSVRAVDRLKNVDTSWYTNKGTALELTEDEVMFMNQLHQVQKEVREVMDMTTGHSGRTKPIAGLDDTDAAVIEVDDHPAAIDADGENSSTVEVNGIVRPTLTQIKRRVAGKKLSHALKAQLSKVKSQRDAVQTERDSLQQELSDARETLDKWRKWYETLTSSGRIAAAPVVEQLDVNGALGFQVLVGDPNSRFVANTFGVNIPAGDCPAGVTAAGNKSPADNEPVSTSGGISRRSTRASSRSATSSHATA